MLPGLCLKIYLFGLLFSVCSERPYAPSTRPLSSGGHPSPLLLCCEARTCNCLSFFNTILLMREEIPDERILNILPVALLTTTFVVTTMKGKRTSISRQQLPITPAYAFTYYRAQTQTIGYCMVDTGKPPNRQIAHDTKESLSCREYRRCSRHANQQ